MSQTQEEATEQLEREWRELDALRARIKELEGALRDLLNWRAPGAGERGREAAERAQAALAGDKGKW